MSLGQESRHAVERDLEAGHVGVELLPQTNIEHQVLQLRESLLLVRVHEEEADTEGETLAVTNLRVEDAVGFQQVEQPALPWPQSSTEISVVGKCSS